MGQIEPKDGLEREKEIAGRHAAALVENGARLGLGSGSTSVHFLRALAQRIRTQGIRVAGVPTSNTVAKIARELGIPLLEPERGLKLDLAIDGADEISPALDLIKGGGGALLREKVVASIARRFVVIADSSKPVSTLGAFPLPVEAVPFAAPVVMDRLLALGGAPAVRPGPDGSGYFVTDQGNQIIDCRFGAIARPAELAAALDAIPGVVGHGLFVAMAHEAVIAEGTQIRMLTRS